MQKNDLPKECIWVGIGASAGGLESITELCRALPESAAAVYIVAQHLSPKYKSMLPELLQRSVKLKVRTITSSVAPQPNTIYVTPPQRDVVVRNGRIALLKASSESIPKPSVNLLFNSMAEELKEHAVGVVLSGTGNDGALGIKAIRAAGGITFAESEGTAKYDGMPEAARDTQCVDYVLSPGEIGKQLGRIAHHTIAGAPRDVEADENKSSFGRLIAAVQKESGLNFRQYKKATLKRRIERRMLAVGITEFDRYVGYVEANSKEANKLFREILISVTDFFRDKSAFEILRKSVDNLLAHKPASEPVRIWSVGCATGEEPYSLAITLAEALGGIDRLTERNVRIFATDVDEHALATARRGLYPEATLADVPPPYIKKYFRKVRDKYEVSKSLRELILFAAHNIIEDPPFQRIDLLVCRNLLIYFEPKLQEKVYKVFHYSLHDRGIMFLGRSESTTNVGNLFKAIDSRNKLFVKKLGPRVRAARELLNLPNGAYRRAADAAGREDLVPLVHPALAKQLGDASLLLDESLSIERVFGDITPYVSIANTRPTWNVTELIGDAHKHELRALCFKALRSGKTESSVLRKTKIDGKAVLTRVRLYPLFAAEQTEKYLLMCFERHDEISPKNRGAGTSSGGERLRGLEDELAAAKEHLQTVIEELETANEELQSTNEELQSSNEELQSSNEELETTNEELQSTNEELVTMNDELQAKTAELEKASTQLLNIKNSLAFPLLLLNTEKKIIRANRQAREFFQASLNDEHISGVVNATVGGSTLNEIIEKVLKTGRREMPQIKIGAVDFCAHITPFRNAHDQVEGVILSLIDVTDELRRKQELEDSQRQAQAATIAKTEFLANMSHEIRTPLQAIHGVGEVLRSKIDDPAKREQLLKILANSTRTLKGLLDDILDFSKLEAGRLQLELAPFSLRELIARTASVYSVRAAEKQLKMLTSIAPDCPDTLVGDETRVGQILGNLLSNAVKFTEHGEVQLNVSTLRHNEGLRLRMEVVDTGIGLSDAQLGTVFDKFTQAGPGIARQYGGTGLGLAIVRELSELMGGGVSVESTLGQGARFTVEISVARASAPVHDSYHRAVKPLFAVGDGSSHGPILVVEDNSENQILIQMCLNDLGCRADMCATVESGLKALESHNYSVLLLDIQIGTNTGFEFMTLMNERLREGKIRQRPTVIALTAHVHEDIRRKCFAAGMEGYLPKPLDLRELRDTLAPLFMQKKAS